MVRGLADSDYVDILFDEIENSEPSTAHTVSICATSCPARCIRTIATYPIGLFGVSDVSIDLRNLSMDPSIHRQYNYLRM